MTFLGCGRFLGTDGAGRIETALPEAGHVRPAPSIPRSTFDLPVKGGTLRASQSSFRGGFGSGIGGGGPTGLIAGTRQDGGAVGGGRGRGGGFVGGRGAGFDGFLAIVQYSSVRYALVSCEQATASHFSRSGVFGL